MPLSETILRDDHNSIFDTESFAKKVYDLLWPYDKSLCCRDEQHTASGLSFDKEGFRDERQACRAQDGHE